MWDYESVTGALQKLKGRTDSPVVGSPNPNNGVWLDRDELRAPEPDVEQLSRLVRRGFGLRKYRPPALPRIAAQLLEMSSSDEVHFEELARLIEQDVMIAAEVMRVTKSPTYSRGIEVTSIEQAIARLGISTLRDIVAEAALEMCVFSSPEHFAIMDRLRVHGASTAHIARLSNDMLRVGYDMAFLAGLFHDVGFAASLLLLCTVYPERVVDPNQLWPELSRIHERTSWHVAVQWDLPEGIRHAVRYHHSPRECPEHPEHPALICVADRLAQEAGAGMVDLEDDASSLVVIPDEVSDEVFADACDILRISRKDLAALREAATGAIFGVV